MTTSAPAPTPAAATARPAPTPPPAERPPRTGELRDSGVARRDTVRAHRWTTHGPVKVDGAVDADEVTLTGPASFGGPVTVGSLRAEGSLDLARTVEVAGPLVVDGSVRADAAVRAGEATFRGALHLRGALSVDRMLSVVGAIAAPSVRAGLFTLDGTAEVSGGIDAQQVDLRFRDRSRLGTIRASKVRLALRPPNPVERILGRHVLVQIDRIEADSVDLEGVDVRFVRAPEIVLGREAHVTEYEGTIVRRHPTARVGPESRSPPPHGLSR